MIRARIALLLALVALAAPVAEAQQKRVVLKKKTYLTGRTLGGGRWARVYEATEQGGADKVAVKIATSRDPVTPEGNTFRRELKVMRTLRGRHRTLPRRVLGLGTVEGTGQDALVLDLIEGEPLPARLPVGEAIHVTIELLDGVAQLHRIGLWHADITPPNVLRDASGNVHLLDFGRTRRIDEPREGPGYPGFSAPEAMDPTRKRGDLQDIHAIGAILRSRLGTVPPELAPIIDRATDREPARRYQSAAEFRDALVKARQALGSQSRGERR